MRAAGACHGDRGRSAVVLRPAAFPTEPVSGSWSSGCAVDPFTVALSTKGDLLVRATNTMLEHGADLAEGLYQLWETRKWFVSSEGHRIEQHVRESGAGIMATAIGDGETQRRSPGGVRHAGVGARRGARP